MQLAFGKVLLVDDEKEFTHVLSERLQKRDLEVESVHSGKEALARVEEESFDAIILDLVMPQMDGIETLKKLRVSHPELNVILLTGHADLKSGIEAMKLGAADFLEKPAEIGKLMEKIKEASTQKAILVQKEMEEKITNILQTKGW